MKHRHVGGKHEARLVDGSDYGLTARGYKYYVSKY